MKLFSAKLFFSKAILNLIACVFLFLNLFIISVSANFPSQIVTEDLINPNQGEVLTLFFHYGQPNLQENIENAQIKLEVRGADLKIIPDSVRDLYFNENQEGFDRPAIPNCSENYTGDEFFIDPKLIQENGFVYGPQTSTSKNTPGGSQITTLAGARTGCIALEFSMKDIKSGDLVEVVFNQNALNSESFSRENRPPLQVVRIRFADPKDQESCNEDQEFVLGQCQATCEETQFRALDGSCKVYENKCEGDFEVFGDECVPKCQESEVRKGDGNCGPKTRDENEKVEEIELCRSGGELVPCETRSVEVSTLQLVLMIASMLAIISAVVYIFISKKRENS